MLIIKANPSKVTFANIEHLIDLIDMILLLSNSFICWISRAVISIESTIFITALSKKTWLTFAPCTNMTWCVKFRNNPDSTLTSVLDYAFYLYLVANVQMGLLVDP